MRVQSVRFGRRDWEAVQKAAGEQGLSASSFVRNWARTGALLESAEEVKTARQLAAEFHAAERAEAEAEAEAQKRGDAARR